MSQHLKPILYVFIGLLIFKVIDKMFLDKALSNVFNWETETLEENYENYEDMQKEKLQSNVARARARAKSLEHYEGKNKKASKK